MSAATAKIVDLEAYRQQRRHAAVAPAPATEPAPAMVPMMCFVPVWYFVPVLALPR